MPKIYYRFGTMGSSKTANALMVKFNYEEKGYRVKLIKPSLDTRDGNNIVKSRIGLESEAISFTRKDDIINWFYSEESICDCIIVDEVQFFTKEQIEDLKYIAELYVPVLCYGLKTNFKSELFEASKRLLEIADSISEIKSICACGKKSLINAKYKDNKIIYDGDEIDIGGNEKYVGMCYKCWKNGDLSEVLDG